MTVTGIATNILSLLSANTLSSNANDPSSALTVAAFVCDSYTVSGPSLTAFSVMYLSIFLSAEFQLNLLFLRNRLVDMLFPFASFPLLKNSSRSMSSFVFI